MFLAHKPIAVKTLVARSPLHEDRGLATAVQCQHQQTNYRSLSRCFLHLQEVFVCEGHEERHITIERTREKNKICEE